MMLLRNGLRFAGLEFDHQYSRAFGLANSAHRSTTSFKLSDSKNPSIGQDELVIRETPVVSLAARYDRMTFRFKHPAIGELTRLLDEGKEQESIQLLGQKVSEVFASLKPEDVQGIKLSHQTTYDGPFSSMRKVRDTLSVHQKGLYLQYFKRILPALVQGAVDSQRIRPMSGEVVRRLEGIRRRVLRQQPVVTRSLIAQMSRSSEMGQCRV
ncbi:MAG TPA: hypothetical protein V6C52_03585 [Coleofasciculaceae cyanobacterium]